MRQNIRLPTTLESMALAILIESFIEDPRLRQGLNFATCTHPPGTCTRPHELFSHCGFTYDEKIVHFTSLYAAQEKRLNSFHLRCLRRILSIRWQDKIPNTVVLERAGLPSIFMLLSQRRLRWLGHVRRMADGRIPKDLLYGELSRGARSRGRPRLRFKDTCKRDLKSASIDIQSWESLAESRDSWRAAVHCGTKQAEQDRTDHLKEKRAARKRSCSIDQAATFHTCRLCGKDCHSRIGLHSHTRRCSDQN